jgi:hypothetical protein
VNEPLKFTLTYNIEARMTTLGLSDIHMFTFTHTSSMMYNDAYSIVVSPVNILMRDNICRSIQSCITIIIKELNNA